MNVKQQAAKYAATFVKENMVIGLGTGSTADYFIDELAQLFQQGVSFRVVASSVLSQIRAHRLGLPATSIDLLSGVDLYIDGADEVSPELVLLKGQGADLVKEKILATSCDQFLVIADESKQVSRIGEKFPIPIEVIPFAWQTVMAQLEKLGGEGDLRKIPGKQNPMLSSHGSLIVDMQFPAERTVEEISDLLDAMPGVVEHGIFKNQATALILGKEKGVDVQWNRENN